MQPKARANDRRILTNIQKKKHNVNAGAVRSQSAGAASAPRTDHQMGSAIYRANKQKQQQNNATTVRSQCAGAAEVPCDDRQCGQESNTILSTHQKTSCRTQYSVTFSVLRCLLCAPEMMRMGICAPRHCAGTVRAVRGLCARGDNPPLGTSAGAGELAHVTSQ